MSDHAVETSPPADKTIPIGGEFLLRTAERFGVPVVLLLLLLWWARTDIVQPLLNAHFEVVEKITEAQDAHTKGLDGLGRKLDELISATKDLSR
jgi:hypothetical protein